MQLPTLAFLTLSTLATLSTSAPNHNALPIAGILPLLGAPKPVTPPAAVAPKPATLPAAVAPKPATLPAAVAPKPATLPVASAPKPATLPAAVAPKPATLPVVSAPKPVTLPVVGAPKPVTPAVGNTGPHTASADNVASNTPAILTYLRSTLTEVRKHTLNINGSLASVNRLDLNYLTNRASSIIVIRAEVTAICYSIAQLNTASISRWTDSIGDLAGVRAQLLGAVQELVWEIVCTLKGAESRLQASIWELLGSQVLVLLSSFGQLFCTLNVWIDGFLRLSLGLLNAQAGLLTSVFAGLTAYVVDIAGGLFTQVTKLFFCLLS